jgi:2-dehydro-3-deoxygalactonokinase
LKANIFLSCDWGTSRCRLRLAKIDSGKIIDGIESDQGATVIAARANSDEERAGLFNAELTDMVRTMQVGAGRSLSGIPIVMSGMVGSTIGWRVIPYAELPIGLDGDGLRVEELEPVLLSDSSTPNPVLLISGLATINDILRGEESEVIGIMQDNDYADFQESSILLLPGTHSKHVIIKQGKITDFQSHMTGEMLAVLSRHSVLRHSLPDTPSEIIPDALRAGVEASQSGGLTSTLFSIRARQVLYDTAPDGNWSFLVGVLLGTELGGLKQMEDDDLVLLCAGDRHRLSYSLALEYLDLADKVTTVASDVMRTAVVNCHRVVAEKFVKG